MAPKREGGVVGKGHNETAKKSKLSKPAKYTENNKKAANFTTKAPKKKLKKTIKICSKTINYSLCIPVSVIDNCKNLEQATHVVYQIAKSAVLFNVGEIVVLDLGARKMFQRSLATAFRCPQYYWWRRCCNTS